MESSKRLIIFRHVPSTEKPCGEKEISLMKDGVFIINAARVGLSMKKHY